MCVWLRIEIRIKPIDGHDNRWQFRQVANKKHTHTYAYVYTHGKTRNYIRTDGRRNVQSRISRVHKLVSLLKFKFEWARLLNKLCTMINYGSNMMHVDQFRKMETYSPKSSPRGGRSPIVSRQDSSGTLKTTISLGKNPSIVHSGPFYLMKEPPGK